MSDDPLRDPRFPNRPQHPDFWRLSSVVTKHDGKTTEGGEQFEDIINQYLDAESLIYMAEGRAGIYCQRIGLPPSYVPLLMGAMIDAVLIGIDFEKEGGHRDA